MQLKRFGFPILVVTLLFVSCKGSGEVIDPTPTASSMMESATSQPEDVPPTAATPTLVCEQDIAQLVPPFGQDSSAENGMAIHPGSLFTVRWHLMNVGTCAWNQNYQLDLVSSDGVSAPPHLNLTQPTAPGETVEIAYEVTAVEQPGNYQPSWKLRNDKGEEIPILSDGHRLLELDFSIFELPEGIHFDFIAARCRAEWHTGEASFVSCKGENAQELGFAQFLSEPIIEGDVKRSYPTIQVKTNDGKRGFIEGIFQPYTVKQGDVFSARIGCMGHSPGCLVRFELHVIKVDGTRAILDDWLQSSDGDIIKVRVPLSNIVGQEVQFVLHTRNDGGKNKEANGFWATPVIENREKKSQP
jgi:hypothetical protein